MVPDHNDEQKTTRFNLRNVAIFGTLGVVCCLGLATTVYGGSLSQENAGASGMRTLFPVIIEQVLISAYLIKNSRIFTEYMENKIIFERYQHLFDYHGKRSKKFTLINPGVDLLAHEPALYAQLIRCKVKQIRSHDQK